MQYNSQTVYYSQIVTLIRLLRSLTATSTQTVMSFSHRYTPEELDHQSYQQVACSKHL